jgi:hypothetical protein
LVYLEIVLILTQDRCTVCPKHTIGSSLITWLNWNLILVHLEIVPILTQDRCTVCVEHTIGSEIVLDASDGTPR